MINQETEKYYKDITFKENKARLKLLIEFRELVIRYFKNSNLNMMSGNYIENQEAADAQNAINLILNRVYTIIRLADIRTSTVSVSALTSISHGKNIDLILNIFNLGRNDISPEIAIEHIESAIDAYRSNRLPSLSRTVNPFFWAMVILNYIAGGANKERTNQ